MDKKQSIKIIKEFTKNLKEDFNVNEIIFFGSRAIGKSRKDSDIDLIIVSDDFKNMSFIERGALMYNYWTYLIPVDFICLTIEEYNRLKKRISIVKEALESGILISK